jgi:hypothetical protein
MPRHQNAYVIGEANIHICAQPIIARLAEAIDNQRAADRVRENMFRAWFPFIEAENAS